MEFQAEHVLDVEGIHHLFAIGRDHRRGDVDIGGGQRSGEIVEQAGAVAGIDLDDRVNLRSVIVESDMGGPAEGAFAFPELVAAMSHHEAHPLLFKLSASNCVSDSLAALSSSAASFSLRFKT